MVQGDPCHFIGIAIHCFDYIVQTPNIEDIHNCNQCTTGNQGHDELLKTRGKLLPTPLRLWHKITVTHKIFNVCI